MRGALLLAVLCVACGKKYDEGKVRDWIRHWDAARTCLLGEIEYGADAETANAAASLMHDTICGGERVGLTHFVVTNIEALPDGEQLYSIVMDATKTPVDEAAIAKAEARAAEHRKLVGLPAVERERRALGLPLVVGPAVDWMSISPQRGPLVFDRDGTRTEIAALGEVRTIPLANDHVLAYPSRGWTAVVADQHLVITVANDPKATPTRVPLTGESFEALAATDAGGVRSVLLSGGPKGLALAVSQDENHAWHVDLSSHDARREHVAQDVETGVVLVLARGSGDFGKLFRVDPEAPVLQSTDIARFHERMRCTTSKAWWSLEGVTGSYVLRRITMEGARTVKEAEIDVRSIDCTDDVAVLVGGPDFKDIVQLCRLDGCSVVHRSKVSERGAAGVLDDGSWIYAASERGVLGVWRDKQPPVFHALPRDVRGRVDGIVVLRGVPHVLIVVDGADVTKLVRLP